MVSDDLQANVRELMQSGENVPPKLLLWLANLEGQQQEIRRLLTDLVRMEGARNVTIGRDSTGSIIIIGDNNRVSVADEGRLERWWHEVGPDPAVLTTEYRQAVAGAFASLRFPLGLINKTICLDDVYVPLPIIKPATDEDLLRPHRSNRRSRGESIPRIDDLFIKGDRAALVGLLGTGKTTTLRHLAWIYTRQPKDSLYWRLSELVPFYARIRDLGEKWSPQERTGGPGRFRQQFAEAISLGMDGACSSQVIERVLAHSLAAKNALILLDALDEFHATPRERQDFMESLQGMLQQQYRDNFVLLTSRPYQFLNPLGFGQYLLLDLEDSSHLVYRLGNAILSARYPGLDEEARERWLDQIHETIESTWLRQLSSSLYVTLIVSLGTSRPTAQEGVNLLRRIDRLTDPYQYFLRQVIQWENSKDSFSEADDDTTLLTLAYAGLYTLLTPRGYSLHEWISEKMRDRVVNVDKVLKFWERTNLLDRDPLRATWTFQHAGFQSFGAALALADATGSASNEWVQKIRTQYEYHPEWEAVWELYMSLEGEKRL